MNQDKRIAVTQAALNLLSNRDAGVIVGGDVTRAITLGAAAVGNREFGTPVSLDRQALLIFIAGHLPASVPYRHVSDMAAGNAADRLKRSDYDTRIGALSDALKALKSGDTPSPMEYGPD